MQGSCRMAGPVSTRAWATLPCWLCHLLTSAQALACFNNQQATTLTASYAMHLANCHAAGSRKAGALPAACRSGTGMISF